MTRSIERGCAETALESVVKCSTGDHSVQSGTMTQ